MRNSPISTERFNGKRLSSEIDLDTDKVHIVYGDSEFMTVDHSGYTRIDGKIVGKFGTSNGCDTWNYSKWQDDDYVLVYRGNERGVENLLKEEVNVAKLLILGQL